MTISPDALIVAATAQTGLDDFGGDGFREGLAVLCDSLSGEAQLNGFGAMALPGAIIAALANRLRVEDWIRRHPEIADERIEAPIVVIGMARAGTTLLSYLLERDPRHRPLFGWEAGASVPPPTPAGLADDARIAAAREARQMVDQINPRIRIVQNEEPDGPTECIAVTGQAFRSVLWEAMANVPTYGRWLFAADHRPAYDYHRRVLQLLQSGGVRGTWSLKAPTHALHPDALTAVYPDARMLLIHRDPAVLCASVCSLIEALTGTFSDADHRAYIADHWVDMLERSIAFVEAFRAAHPAHGIIDIHYAELAADPIATMRRVYAELGEELGGQALAAMQAHVAAHPKGRFGRHGYDLATFGLDPGAIAERFKAYVERYDIAPEPIGAAAHQESRP